jgi:hypothetical protein
MLEPESARDEALLRAEAVRCGTAGRWDYTGVPKVTRERVTEPLLCELATAFKRV